MTSERMGEPVPSDMTYDELALMMGYRMISIVGLMEQLGLTTLPHFVKSYLDPSETDDPMLRDFDRWLKWALSPKHYEGREHLLSIDFVKACQATLQKRK
jgi:hypothetical protein